MDIPRELIQAMRTAENIVALTGAGISAESGLRTFRDVHTGLWSQHRPEDLATMEAFLRNPKLVWEWYAMRRERATSVKPNPGHYALVDMAMYIPHFHVITQNVDDLHNRAGSLDVIELHGNIQRVKCTASCGMVETWEETSEVPVCPTCGALLRPDVVWFGEQLPRVALERAVIEARSCDMFFSIGTSGLVQPAAALAYAAKNRGALIVEVNLELTSLSGKVDFGLYGKAGEILPLLVQIVWLKN